MRQRRPCRAAASFDSAQDKRARRRTALEILSKLFLRDLCLFQDGFQGPAVNFFVVRDDEDGSGLIVSYLDVSPPIKDGPSIESGHDK